MNSTSKQFEHQIFEVVLFTHYGFNIEISNIFELYTIQPQNSTVIQHWHLR